MACYHPIPAYQEAAEPPKLWPPLGHSNLAIPCGTCIGCKSARATQWAHRCAHEASQYPVNSFLTLTYDDDNLPFAGYLDARALSLFLKRLRKRADRDRQTVRGDGSGRVRYFACGEYGEKNGRPHYHLIAFNCGFADRFKVGTDLYESPTLAELWPYGQARFGDATPAAANYIAQYTLKKQMRNRAYYKDEGYNGESYVDDNGEWHPKPAPFLRMSLKPGIGTTWLERFGEDLRMGYLVVDGAKQAIPRSYKNKLKDHKHKRFRQLYEEVTIRTQERRKQNPTGIHNTPERRQAAEQIHKRMKQLTEHRKL